MTIKALLPTAAEGSKLVETNDHSKEADQSEEVRNGEPEAKSEDPTLKSDAPPPPEKAKNSTLQLPAPNMEPKAEHPMSQSPHAEVKHLLILILLLYHLLSTDCYIIDLGKWEY